MKCVSTGKEDDAALFSVNNWYTAKTLRFVVCLFTKDEGKLCNDLAVTKAMNCVCEKAGDRFVYSYVAKKRTIKPISYTITGTASRPKMHVL